MPIRGVVGRSEDGVVFFCRCGRRHIASLDSCWKVCDVCGRMMWLAVLASGSYVVGFEIQGPALTFPEIWAICVGMWWEEIEAEAREVSDREETWWDRWLRKVGQDEATWRNLERAWRQWEMKLEADYWAAWMAETEEAGRLEKEYEKAWKRYKPPEPPLSFRQIRLLKLQEWAEENKKWQEWKDRCERSTCLGCGWYKNACRCKNRGFWWLLKEMRKLAGINPSPGSRKGLHTDLLENLTWNKGPEGFRKCGAAFWENTVRAWEEDR